VAWRNKSTASHPLYRTAGQDYGTKPIGDESKLLPSSCPKAGGFTKTFAGGGAQMSGGLRTGVTTHRYLREMDGMS